MDLYFKTFQEALSQNEIDEQKWHSYRNEVDQTRSTINTFLKSYKLEIMVPLGRKAFVRGRLQHTNDVLMSHNSNYFSLMSNSQANEIMDMRARTCNEHIKLIQQERDLYRGKLEAPDNEAFGDDEIIEPYDEQAETEWRKKHRESVRRQKMKESEERQKANGEENIDELLDRFELLEEMANELETLESDGVDISNETITKLISGEIKTPQSQTRASYGKLEEKEQQQSKERRKVTFSSFLEDIKIFDSISSQRDTETKSSTIAISFKHSPAKFIEPPPGESDDEVLFRHPGNIYAKFKEHAAVKTKSILKETNYDPKTSVRESSTRESLQRKLLDEQDDEQLSSISFSSFPLICNDEVIERGANNPKNEFINVDAKPKRVSKFKEMRTKIKS